MKLTTIYMFPNAKATLALAVCTLLATGAALRADDNSDATKSKGAPDSGTTAESGTRSSKLSHGDQKFIHEAAKGGMMEVQMGRLGVQKAQNDQVKQFAQRLIDDHTKANSELKQLAASKGITLPDDKFAGTSETDRTKVREETDSTAHMSHPMKKLETLSGTDFDREFVRMAVSDHEKDVKEFEKEAQKADDSDVRAFAQKTAPTLREHLQQAKSLQSQVGAGSGHSSTSSGSAPALGGSDRGTSSSTSGSSGPGTVGSGIK